MNAESIGAIAAIVTIFFGILAAIKWGRAILTKLWHFISRYKPKVPRETIRILPQIHGCWWGQGSVSGKPAMQVAGHWHVTNITGNEVLLLATCISKPRTDGNILTRHPEENIFGGYPILPGDTTEVISDFWVVPPVRNVGEDFKTSVVMTDQYGNEHKIKNVVFKGRSPKEPEKKGPSLEPIHSISDPIEKEVVAVLKTEVNRYKDCGRRSGGLGSIQTTIRDHTYTGIGTEWREVDSPKNQSIEENEEEISITSDNAQALLNLHSKLTSDDEKQRFYNALLKRVSRETEYAPVAYLILYVLFQLDRLNEVLEKAISNLKGDEAHGFSDLLIFLDALLRFRHTNFSPEMLDYIEQYIEGIDEHTYRIPERLAAIRSFRLARQC